MSDIPLPPPFDWRLIIEAGKLCIDNKPLIDLLDAVISEDMNAIREKSIMLCNEYLAEEEDE